MSKADDIKAVKKTIGVFGAAFAKRDVDTILSVWDDQYETPMWQPEEILEPLLTQEAVQGYFRNLPNAIKGVTDIKPMNFAVDVIGDFAHCLSRATATIHLHDRPSVTGEVRQTFILRKRDDKWRLIHQHESRLTPGFN